MKKIEFSKLILGLVMCTYFIGLIIGAYVVLTITDTNYISAALCGLFSYIGAPVAVAIGFYSNKAKAENIEKIKNGSPMPEIIEERFDENDSNR